MKIILVNYRYFVSGGPETYMFNFMSLAESKGSKVIPFSVNYSRNLHSDFDRYFVSPSAGDNDGGYTQANRDIKSLWRIVIREFFNREAYYKLRKLIQDERPDLIYCLIPGSLSASVFLAAKAEKVPVVLRLSDFRLICGKNTLMRNSIICEDCIKGNYKKCFQNRCVKGSFFASALRTTSLYYHRIFKTYKYVDAVVSPAKFTCQKLIESCYFTANKMHYNPTFINSQQIKPCYTNRNYVLCLGRFSEEKGFLFTVEAMKYLRDIPVYIIITGEKENCDTRINKLIEDFGLEDKVKFAGFVRGNELNDLIMGAMCIACPAIWYENLPNVVLEAYAYGKPVIASNLGSLSEIVENGKTGLLFPPKDSKSIARCIRQLYEQPELCSELGRNARQRCEMKFSPELHWNTFISIYNSILEKEANL